MKKYNEFIRQLNEEDLFTKEKEAIADNTDDTDDSVVDKMAMEEKPNDAIINDVKKEIEGYEQQKVVVNNRIEEINKKIELFNSQAKETRDPQMQKDLNNKVKSMNDSLNKFKEELTKFDKLIADSGKRQKQLIDTNKPK